VKYGVLAAVLAILLQTFSSSLALGVTLVVWYLLGGKRTLYLIYHTLDRDGRTAVRFIHLLWVNLNAKWRNQSVGDLFLKTADRIPEKTMMVLCHETGEEKMTFRECKEMSCQVARYFLKQGYKKGDVVGLVMENRIDYCCYWIGLSMIGVIPALINSNLRQQSLLHTLTVAKCKAVIFSSELCEGRYQLLCMIGRLSKLVWTRFLKLFHNPMAPRDIVSLNFLMHSRAKMKIPLLYDLLFSNRY